MAQCFWKSTLSATGYGLNTPLATIAFRVPFATSSARYFSGERHVVREPCDGDHPNGRIRGDVVAGGKPRLGRLPAPASSRVDVAQRTSSALVRFMARDRQLPR